MSVETEHFIFHFYDNTEPLVAPAVVIAEEVFPELENIYGMNDRNKINIVLGDYDDVSNGFADWLGNGVEIWTPDLFFQYRGNTTWLRNVLTHELTHIVTLRKSEGAQMLATTVSVGLHGPGFDLAVAKTLPMTAIFPSWLAEGLAQTGSTRCGNDCWDSRRDMILRCAVLDNTLLPLDQMGVFAHDDLGNEMVYNQGFSLTMYLEQMVGIDEFRRIIKRSSAPWDLAAGFEAPPDARFGGRELDHYYLQWRDSLRYAARRVLPVQPTETRLVWQHGVLNQQPRVAGKSGVWGWLTNNNDDSQRSDLVIARKGSTEPLQVVQHAEISWDFNAGGDRVYFVKSYDPGEHGSYLNELYRCTIATGKTEQLTRGGRIYACAVSQDNVAVVRFGKGRFSLQLFDVNTRTYRVIDPGMPGNTFGAIDFDPADPSKLVVERIVEGRSSLYIDDLKSGASMRISSGLGQEESPHWSRNGRIYYSADYDGIFNIYSIKADGSDLQRHTSVVGGAFEPTLDDDGATLLFSEYTSSGFKIVQTGLTSAAYTIPQRAQCYFKPLQANAFQLPAVKPYSMRMLRASWESAISLDITENGATAGISLVRSQSDALNRFNYVLGAGFDGGVEASGIRSSLAPGENALRYEITERFNRFRARVDSMAGIRPATDRFLPAPRPSELSIVNYSANPRLDATSSGITPFLLVGPQCGFVLQSLAPTISSEAQLTLLDVVLPVSLNSQTDISLQVGRDATVGASFVADVNLYKMTLSYLAQSDTAMRKSTDSLYMPDAGAELPLWFTWQNMGYYNQDIQHNYNDVWEAGLTITPSNAAGRKYRAADSTRDSLFSVKGISGQIDVMHAFPLSKYSGVPVELRFNVSRFATPVNGTEFDTFSLKGNADLYARLEATVMYDFPIARTIKSGRRLFFDALYGHFGYFFSATANRSFLERLQNSGNGWADILANNAGARNPDDGFYASHIVFFTAEVNTFAEFLFPGAVSVTAMTDVVHGGFGLSVAAQF